MAKLGPELFEVLNARQRVGNRLPVIYGAPGLSPREFASIEEQLGFRLPEDFRFLFANLQDAGRVFFPWSAFSKEGYDASMARVWHGIAFDIEHGLWLDRWGDRPAAPAEAAEVAKADFVTWPRLLPLYGHRFLAAEPCRNGNPVFSIRQTDIVYYGSDLANYLMNEFLPVQQTTGEVRRIEVWSDFAEGRYLAPTALPDDLADLSCVLRSGANRR
ncbi:MAG: hypothetical protein JSS04_02175 [Proteobacteria bacterium]|nr:hypothetical protein [Pseudomonadota bacterium]